MPNTASSKAIKKVAVHGIRFIGLTLVTQIGGLAELLALLASRYVRGLRASRAATFTILFVFNYAVLSVAATSVAPLLGRVSLPCRVSNDELLAMQSPIFCVLNRHYVTPELKAVATELSAAIDERFPGTVTLALDGSFPFFDGFPLLPHLSHRDGRKLDLAFYYRRPDGDYIRGATRSPIGYWAFEAPPSGATLPCDGRDDLLTLRWDVPWFGHFLNSYVIDVDRTRAALQWLAAAGREAGVSKILIEPHLASTLGVHSDIIRFQGCRAARHDDHIHIQVGR